MRGNKAKSFHTFIFKAFHTTFSRKVILKKRKKIYLISDQKNMSMNSNQDNSSFR